MNFEESVGAVVFHKDSFLVLKYGAGHWGFVKGHIEEGETKKETLMRELEEETGVTDAEVIPGFEEGIGYYFHKGRVLVSKKVTFFLLKSSAKKIKLSHEHVDFDWLPFDKAVDKLSFDNTKRVLRKAKDFLLSRQHSCN
jgi:8-oxo-dGTP pyrophosphatase MutT (NUDIX family)